MSPGTQANVSDSLRFGDNPLRTTPTVNTNPRQLQLLEEVRARKSATVEQLADTLGVTLQTVRRDVQRLAESGLLTRFHGGVRVPSSTVENLSLIHI